MVLKACIFINYDQIWILNSSEKMITMWRWWSHERKSTWCDFRGERMNKTDCLFSGKKKAIVRAIKQGRM